MPLIKKQKKEVLVPLTVRMEEGLFSRLTDYATYMESTKDHVITEAIRYIINRDKEFTKSLHQNAHQDPHQNVGETRHQITKAAK